MLIKEKPTGKILSRKTKPQPVGDYMKCNWSQYNKALENRGSINFWFSSDAVKKWRADPAEKAGRPFKFSDDAILTLLILKFVYHLPFRQLSGFAKSLITILHLSIEVPHYTCINKRMKKLQVPPHILSKRKRLINPS